MGGVWVYIEECAGVCGYAFLMYKFKKSQVKYARFI